MQFNGHAIRALRKATGLNVSQLAAAAGIKQPHMTLIEQGHRQPSDEVGMRIALALDLEDLRAILCDPGANPVPVWLEGAE